MMLSMLRSPGGYKLAFTVQPPDGTIDAGDTITPAIKVAVQNYLGQTMKGDNSTQITIAKSGGSGTLSGTTTQTCVAGIATFDDLSLDAADTYTLTVTATGLLSQTSNAFEILAGVWVPSDTTSLVAVWDPSADGSGQTLSDTYGSHDAQLGSTAGADANDPTWVAGPPLVLSYDGGDYCDADGSGDGTWGDITASITIIAVVKDDDTAGFEGICGKWKSSGTPTTTMQWNLRCHAGAYFNFIYAFSGSNYNLNTANGSRTTNWLTVAISFTSGAQQMYVNGLASGAAASQAHTLTSVHDAKILIASQITDDPTNNAFSGDIGQVLIYNAAKNATEMKAIHNDIRSNFTNYGLPEAV
jgi:hypothetical protein